MLLLLLLLLCHGASTQAVQQTLAAAPQAAAAAVVPTPGSAAAAARGGGRQQGAEAAAAAATATQPAAAAAAAGPSQAPPSVALGSGSRSTSLIGALLGALGAAQPASPQQRRRGSSSQATHGRTTAAAAAGTAEAAYASLRSSGEVADGLVRGPDGGLMCVTRSQDLPLRPDSSSSSSSSSSGGAGGLSFASVGDQVWDPACDDDAIVDRSGMACDDAAATGVAPAAAAAAGPASAAATPNANKLACTKGFMRVGSAPRSVAVVLLRWSRAYYKTREECCAGNDAPDCDCKWGGRTWDNLPPPAAYSRMFTDECTSNGRPSVNRAFYDFSGGMVTFHSRLIVPEPASQATETAARAALTAGAAPPQPAAAATMGSLQPVVTDKSYLDPQGVDVYGWATLDVMRDAAGSCLDWCSEAAAQLGVDKAAYNHIVCMPLNTNSKGVCEKCSPGGPDACVGTCPASVATAGVTSGCGCGTCDYAWGNQRGCNWAAPAGAKTGISVPMSTYPDTEAPVLPGGAPRPLIDMTLGHGRYIAHEIGHNLGFTHTGSLTCAVSGSAIQRDATSCRPETYGDPTSMMGAGQTVQIPATLRYKMRWLPRGTLKQHPLGTEARYTLRAPTSRQPSLQPAGAPIRWFDPANDVVAVRVPLTAPGAAVGGYRCPCPTCPACTCSGMTAVAGCCRDPACADDGLGFLVIELFQPYRNDANPTLKGVAIRMTGSLSNCTSTRLVPTHLTTEATQAYLLTTPDPAGAALGSRYEDAMRGVSVVLEAWTRARAVVRVRA